MAVKNIPPEPLDEFNQKWQSFSWPENMTTIQTEHLSDDVVRQDIKLWAYSSDDPQNLRHAVNGISYQVGEKPVGEETAEEAEYVVGFMLSMARLICQKHGILGYEKP